MVHMKMLVRFQRNGCISHILPSMLKGLIRSGLKYICKKRWATFLKIKIVLILRPDYLFTSRFEHMFFFFFFFCFCFLHIKGQHFFFLRKTTINDPTSEDQRVDPLAIMYIVNCTVC